MISILRKSFLFLSVIACANAFSLHMARDSSRSNLNSLPSSQHLAPRTTARSAVATGLDEYGSRHSFRSRVGAAFGGIKRRMKRHRPQVEVIEDVSDFDSILKSTKEDFVAVFFHSPVCKACQIAAPHFQKLAQKYSNVKFLSVPLTPMNKEVLQKDLGVKKFPFGHIYHSEHGLLDELPFLRKFAPQFDDRLQSLINSYVNPSKREKCQEDILPL
mmetsp:Transcript_89282/g.257516  ORF Transcript_89282/g.257516 Transcript_89282/m.257516 type:complete len:216 (+) Transcript_89282:25-672(+)